MSDLGPPTPPPQTHRFAVVRRVVEASNPLVRRLLDSRFAEPLGRYLLVLESRGRRSGSAFQTPVGDVRRGGRVVLVTSPAFRWWPNLAGGADLQGRPPEGWRAGRGEVVTPDRGTATGNALLVLVSLDGAPD